MAIKDIYCQAKALNLLQIAFASERASQSYIFVGPEGVGKFKTAMEWSKLLLCQNPVIDKTANSEPAESCGICDSCKLMNTLSHPDFIHIYKELLEFTKDGKNRKNPVDLPKAVVKEFLVEKASIRPGMAKRKVFVVSEAEKLNPASQNTLLKVLEEPPEFCTIILLCTRLEKLLPTTKSRCQIIRFGPIEENQITEKLTNPGLNNTKAKYLAALADGSLGRAIQWANLPPDQADLYTIKKEIISSLISTTYAQSLDLSEFFRQKSKMLAAAYAEIDDNSGKTDINRKAQKTIILTIIASLRDTMKINFTKPENLINSDQYEQIKKLANKFSPEQAAKSIENCYQAMQWIDASVNEKLIFEHLLLNLSISATMTA